RRHTRFSRDWSSDVCSSDLIEIDFRAQAPDEKLAGDLLFALLVDCAAALGLDHVIWDRRIWVARERGGPRPFAGADAHGGRLRKSGTAPRRGRGRVSQPPRA